MNPIMMWGLGRYYEEEEKPMIALFKAKRTSK
jgi:hypothetical protein